MSKTYKITRIQTITVDIEAKDDAEMRALYSDGTVDDHLSQWEGLDREEAVYIYQVDGNIVDIWKEEEVSDEEIDDKLKREYIKKFNDYCINETLKSTAPPYDDDLEEVSDDNTRTN